MKDILPGLKTKITGWAMALLPALAMLEYEIDPYMVEVFFSDFWGWIAAGYAGLGGLNHFFRNLANK